MFSSFSVKAYTITSPIGATTIGGLVTNALPYIYSFLGIILVGLVMYGGFMFLTSTGDAQKLKQAQGVIVNAFIGAVIILAAFLIVEIFGDVVGVPGIIP